MRLHDLSVYLLCKNLLSDCFIRLFTNSYLRFLYILSYLFVMTGKFLWPNFSSIFFSFSHNALTLSTITSFSLFFHVYFVIFKTILYIHKKVNFYYLHKVVNNFWLFTLIKITPSFFNFYIFNGIAFSRAALKPDLIKFFIKV